MFGLDFFFFCGSLLQSGSDRQLFVYTLLYMQGGILVYGQGGTVYSYGKNMKTADRRNTRPCLFCPLPVTVTGGASELPPLLFLLFAACAVGVG